MGLEVEWYDFVCFGIVGVAFAAALWVLWINEGDTQSDYGILGETLLLENQVLLPKAIDYLTTSQLWTSCWRGVHPLVLLATRFLSFIIMAMLLSFDFLEYDSTIFLYYTEWTFILVMKYFALGTTVSAYGCWKLLSKPPLQNGEMDEFLRRDLEESMLITNGKETKGSFSLPNRYVEDDFKQRAGFWGYVMQITYQTSAGAVMLTDVVFWCIIVPIMSMAHFKLNMLMGCMHILNAVLLLLDTALNNLPFPWFRIAYFVLWSCAYIIFQWVIHACGFTWWPYPFLELNATWAPLWYFCMAVVHIPCYGMYSLIVKAKITILLRLFPRAFLRSC